MQNSPETRLSLLARIRDPGDARAWTEFAEIYEPVVYRLATRRGLQDADAWDLTQQVMMAVAAQIDQWDPDRTKGTFRAWLLTVARNLIVNVLVKRSRGPAAGDTSVQQMLAQQPAPPGAESQLFDLEYRRQVFRWAADQVRVEFRETTWLAFWRTCVEQLPIADAAQQLELSVGAVYVARSRVLARLRAKVQAFQQAECDGGADNDSI